MATRYNPYALDPALSAGIGNLTKALIGSASDDAAIARGRASDALAGYRQAQTRGENLKSQFAQDQLNRQTKALSDSELVNSIFNTLGLPSQRVEQGEDIATSPGMASAMGVNQGQSIPFNRTVPINYDPEAIKSLVGSTLFGGVPGNPQQSSEMGLNLQEMTKNNLARNLLLASNQSPDRIAAILGGMNPGQFFDQNAMIDKENIKSQTKHEETDKTVEGKIVEKKIEVEASKKEKILELSNKIDLKKLELKSDQEIAAEEQKALAAFREFKVNEDNKNEIKKQKIINENSVKIEKLKLSQKTKSEEESRKIEQQIAKLEEQTKLKIAKMKDDTVRFKFENEPVTITKKAGEQYVLSPKLGKRLGYEPNEDGLYIIDGGYDPSKVRVKIGKEDVLLTKKDAELLNVKPNEQGQYIYKGSGYPDSGLTDAKKFDTKYNADFQLAQEKERYKLPTNISINLRAMLQDSVNADVANGGEFTQVYNDTVIPYINGGNTQLNPPGVSGQNRKFVVPTFLLKTIREQVAKARKPNSGVNLENFKKQYIEMLQNLGYSNVRSNYIYDEASE